MRLGLWETGRVAHVTECPGRHGPAGVIDR